MKKLMMLCLLVACGDDAPTPPDASVDGVLVDASVDAPSDASVDAAPDATPDADPCWMHRYPQCGNEIYDVCVPYSGCGTWTCDGQTYGYCGPGGV